MLKNTFGQSIGSTIEKSGILVEASNKVKAPRLLLPAPKPGSPLKSYGSGPTINLPSKTQSTLDNAYSYNLGKRNTMYNTTNTTTKTPIKLKSNNNTPSITPVNKKVNSDVSKSPLIQEAKKYKSAEPITSVNPTGGILVDYTPQARMTAPLGEKYDHSGELNEEKSRYSNYSLSWST